MEIALIILVLITVYAVFLGGLAFLYDSRLRLQYRLQKINEMFDSGDGTDDIRSLPFHDRVVAPFYRAFTGLMLKITPYGYRSSLEKRLKLAGYPFGFRVGTWILLQIIFCLILPVFIVISIYVFKLPPIFRLLCLILACISILLPNTAINRSIRMRKQRLVRQLPDMLDLLTVSVEAGLSFDGSLLQIVEKAKGELGKEFQNTIREIQLGKSRREALMDLSRSCDVPDISNFVTSFLQADQLGVSMGKILRVQAEQARDKRRMRAREHAMKLPVKIIVPMVFFIFPTIFVVILGPAIIQIYNVLLKR